MKTQAVAEPESGDKWEVQLRKGCLELAILAALWGGKLYGLEILRRLESDSALIVSEGTVYPLLSRLRRWNCCKASGSNRKAGIRGNTMCSQRRANSGRWRWPQLGGASPGA